MALSKYRMIGPGHHISSFSKCGGYLMLEDRSVWSAEPADMARVRRWTQYVPVSISEGRNGTYWLVCPCHSHDERVLVGFCGHLAEKPMRYAMAS
jgi:5-keto 4-deoxyuronate isomerase